MALPAAGIFAWLLGLFGSTFTTFATWMVTRFAYEKGIQYALITAFLVASAALTAALSVSMKALIISAQVSMPDSLGIATYFLPSNINQVFAIIVTLRVSVMLWRWTVRTMSAYLPTDPKHGLLL